MASSIYVGNLPRTMTEDELYGLFAVYGQVRSVKIILNREGQVSYGFVAMNLGAEAAIMDLHGREMAGSKLHVCLALDRGIFTKLSDRVD